ncbi:MAG: bacteriohemerythrin [Methylomonas sp.]|jgi:diguanylate cyclase (GGDEF)-like protein/hemerythrin-like metal-binding protein/PAS domain S-box-containing protein|uniref:bacteriohemerythrin n=1 Tax=Methylomonas sp. TaxID=418 RepID=UPI0025EEA22C|nr:bacteriohemerythrin [Methylomonas sp.]MCK9608309.1 bacteriohemerythrin [Methylomonas sp.]
MNSIDIFPWNENFNTELAEIDEQHKKLVRLLNSLASHVAFQSDLPTVNILFDELTDYARHHFQSEEALWNQYLPEDLLEVQHKKVHNEFVEAVLKLKQEQMVTAENMALEEILSFLARWLAGHILENDRYLAYIVLAMRSGLPLEAAKQQADEKIAEARHALIDVILSIYKNLSSNTWQLMRELAQHKRDDEFSRKLLLAVEQSPSSIVITDLDGTIEFVNEAFLKATGYSRDETVGRNPRILQSGKTSGETFRTMWDVLAQGRVWQGEFVNKRKDGSEYTELALISPVHQADGTVTHYLAIKDDITERKRVEKALRDSHQQMDSLLNSMAEGAYGVDTEGNCRFVNQSFLRMLGYASEDVIGKHIHEIIHHSHQDGSHYPAEECKMYTAYRRQEDVHVVDEVFWRKDGTSIPVEYWSQPIIIDGILTGAIATFIDITARKQAEHQLRIAATVFESQEGMMVTDADNRILRVNTAFTKITGYPPEDVIGRNPSILRSSRQDQDFYVAMWRRIHEQGAWEGEVWNRRKNGEIYPEYLTINAVKDHKGRVTHYVSTLTDITLRKSAAEEIERLAFYDPLTGLPNRRLLQERLKQALAKCHRSGRKGALLFIDIDNFKTLNDTLGHAMGDLLLQQVAARLQACVRENDTVARLGGDEFVVMLEELDQDIYAAAKQTERIGEKILDTINQPFKLSKHDYISTPSIGAALFNGIEQADEMLKQADIAMYQAKTSGRNALCFFDPQMQDRLIAKASLENELRKAFSRRQFQLYYQMQVNAAHQPVGVEVLIRWFHPERGVVSPAEFIPLAEENGMIVDIGRWVLEQACAQIKAWQQLPAARGLVLSINVSPKQFFQADFVSQVQEVIQKYKVEPRLLKLELTESILIEKIENTIATMSALGAIGVQFSLDDFGTGYSSLQYLKKLPLNQLKIDQSFVRDIAFDSGDQAIVRTIIAMANSLNLDVIAEGVETEQQRLFLLNNGCNHYQGFLFSRPVPVGQFEALLQ